VCLTADEGNVGGRGEGGENILYVRQKNRLISVQKSLLEVSKTNFSLKGQCHEMNFWKLQNQNCTF
jgi:hypothetical protein